MTALPHARRRTQRLRVGALATLALLVLAAALAPLPAQAQTGLVLTSVRGLDFGRFAAGQGAGGSVTMATSGMRSSAGGVILLASSGSSGSAAASFHLARSGAASAPALAVSLSLPASGSVLLSNGARQMTVGAFQAWPASIASLPDGGVDIAIGATLDVAPGQAAGAYNGAFSVTVNYE
jgi:hypothetical protein